MRNQLWLWVAVCALSTFTACEIGDGSFDGSFFEDGSFDEDSGDDEDAGTPVKDAGKDAGSDAGKDAGSDAGKDAGAPDLKPTDVPGVLAKGVCGALKACLGDRMLSDTLQGNDCVEFTTRQQADRQLHWLASSVDAKRVTFRPEKLEQCQKDLTALGCSVRSRRLPASCEEAVEGKVQTDGDCSIDQDCTGNGWCDKGMLESCPGACASLQTEGMPCRSSMQCLDGLICRAGMCESPLSEGESCNTAEGLDCPPGLVCHGPRNMRTCQSIETLYVGKQGEACDAFGKLCQMGLVCRSNDPTKTTGTCESPVQANAACRPSQPGQCPINQYCKNKTSSESADPGTEGVCSDRPKDGQACIDGEDCSPGTVCVADGSNQVCRTLKTAGNACVANAQCYGGQCEDDICTITTIECKI